MTQTEKMIEGSLDILWENNAEPRATPKYGLVFARYRNFRNGAQPIKRLVGARTLKSYLIELNFMPEDASNWISELNQKKSVSIPNVCLTPRFVAEYEQISN